MPYDSSTQGDAISDAISMRSRSILGLISGSIPGAISSPISGRELGSISGREIGCGAVRGGGATQRSMRLQS